MNTTNQTLSKEEMAVRNAKRLVTKMALAEGMARGAANLRLARQNTAAAVDELKRAEARLARVTK